MLASLEDNNRNQIGIQYLVVQTSKSCQLPAFVHWIAPMKICLADATAMVLNLDSFDYRKKIH